MSGYDAKTGIFELTATKADYWFRRKEIPADVIKDCTSRWDIIKAVLVWQSLEITKDGGNYLHVKANPDQLWEALSGQKSDPKRASHYYNNQS